MKSESENVLDNDVAVALLLTEPRQELQLDGVELCVRELGQVQVSHPAGRGLPWRGPGWLSDWRLWTGSDLLQGGRGL